MENIKDPEWKPDYKWVQSVSTPYAAILQLADNATKWLIQSCTRIKDCMETTKPRKKKDDLEQFKEKHNPELDAFAVHDIHQKLEKYFLETISYHKNIC